MLIIRGTLAKAVNVGNFPFAVRVRVCQLTLSIGETVIVEFARY